MKNANDLAKEYTKNQLKIKALSDRNSEIREQFEAQGSFSTKDFMIIVEERSRRSLAGLEICEKALGLDLSSYGLVKEVRFKTVSLKPKEHVKEVVTKNVTEERARH